MKKTLMCASAVMAFAGLSFTAQAEDGWYGRADIGSTPEGTLDHDAEPGIPYTLECTGRFRSRGRSLILVYLRAAKTASRKLS